MITVYRSNVDTSHRPTYFYELIFYLFTFLNSWTYDFTKAPQRFCVVYLITAPIGNWIHYETITKVCNRDGKSLPFFSPITALQRNLAPPLDPR